MSYVYKVRHKPTGRWVTGKYWNPINPGSKKPPIGKTWNDKRCAQAHLDYIERDPRGNLLGQYELVEFFLAEVKHDAAT